MIVSRISTTRGGIKSIDLFINKLYLQYLYLTIFAKIVININLHRYALPNRIGNAILSCNRIIKVEIALLGTVCLLWKCYYLISDDENH